MRSIPCLKPGPTQCCPSGRALRPLVPAPSPCPARQLTFPSSHHAPPRTLSRRSRAVQLNQPLSELPWTPPHIGFPYGPTVELEGREVDSTAVATMLKPFVADGRVERIENVVDERTYNILPIVENPHDMGNLAAVCRSADAMGFGSLHVIYTQQDEYSYKAKKRNSAGADKWLDVQMWRSSTTECLQAIKDAGYQIVVTHLSKSSITIQEVDWTKPTAFLLGSEKFGATEEAVAMADHCAIIPMLGFVESFNISVAGALTMYEANQQRIRKFGRNGDLNEDQKEILKGQFMLRTVREGPSVIRALMDRPPPPQKNQVERARRLQARTSETA